MRPRLNIVWALLTLSALPAFSQNKYPDFLIAVGGSVNVLHQQDRSDWNSVAYGTNVSFFSNRPIADRTSLLLGITYQYSATQDYRNTVRWVSNWQSGTYDLDVNLKTAITMQYFEVPLILKKFFGKYSFGAGAKASFLLQAYFSQQAVGTYTNPNYPNSDQWITDQVKFVFGVDDYVSNAPFTRTNIAPLLNVGYAINKRLGVEYFLSYDLLANPRMHYKFNEYNSLNNNINLTFKFN